MASSTVTLTASAMRKACLSPSLRVTASTGSWGTSLPLGTWSSLWLEALVSSTMKLRHTIAEAPGRFSKATASLTSLPLRGWLADSQQQLIAALAAISEETLSLPVPEALRRPPLTGTVGEALARLAFHEGYHNGQIGLLRRLAGKPGAIA